MLEVCSEVLVRRLKTHHYTIWIKVWLWTGEYWCRIECNSDNEVVYISRWLFKFTKYMQVPAIQYPQIAQGVGYLCVNATCTLCLVIQRNFIFHPNSPLRETSKFLEANKPSYNKHQRSSTTTLWNTIHYQSHRRASSFHFLPLLLHDNEESFRISLQDSHSGQWIMLI